MRPLPIRTALFEEDRRSGFPEGCEVLYPPKTVSESPTTHPERSGRLYPRGTAHGLLDSKGCPASTLARQDIVGDVVDSNKLSFGYSNRFRAEATARPSWALRRQALGSSRTTKSGTRATQWVAVS